MGDIQKSIQRKSLGRAAIIGSLYNATSDTFCGTTLLLKEKFPNDSISRVEIPNSELLYEHEGSSREMFNKLQVEDELKLSVLAELFSLDGTEKYLGDVRESFKSVKGNFIHRMTSVEEN